MLKIQPVIFSLMLTLLCCWQPLIGAEDDMSWPRQITAGEWIVTIYQPQTDSYEGTLWESRAAVSVRRTGGTGEPVFGAVWLTSRVDIDREARLVTIREVKVPEVKFAESGQEERDALARLLEAEIPKWELTFDLDRLIADLGEGGDFATTPGIKNDPPVFVHSTEPAVLLIFDGEPKTEVIKGADRFERIVNTPFPIVRERGSQLFYLFGGEDYWYSASDPTGAWGVSENVPAAVNELMKDIEPPEAFEASESGDRIPAPKIIVATEPTELIVTQGEPKWAPIDNLDLLYLSNTDSDVFLDIKTQLYYVLASGRWFAGRAVDKNFVWENVPNDELPEAFSDIGPDSVNGEVLSHVAGTEQAREEALENTIPQTAAVKRDDTSFKVSYDGEPKFEPVKDLPEVRYAVNTATSVFIANGKYWACENAIWYTAASATGPWAVATEIPASLYKIPTSNPHHNVTYVHIYETTPQVVYVGYTPGYVGSYWYRGCVVWGTGWYYHPWYGPYYYPRPWTWGLSVHYSPWYGWSFRVGWSNGPFYWSVGWGGGYRGPWYGGWWGPGGYRPPYYRPYPPPGYWKPRPTPYPGARPGQLPAVGARPGQLPAGGRPSTLPADNIYNRPATGDKVVAQPTTRDRARPSQLDSPNNVLTDRSGNIYRPAEGGGWETREGGRWRPAEGLDRPATPSTRPAQPSARPAAPAARPTVPAQRPSTRPAAPTVRPSTQPSRPSAGAATRPQLERDYRSRVRGTQRVQQRPPTRAPRPSPRPR